MSSGSSVGEFDEWRDVPSPSEFGTQLDQFNRCTFEPVDAEGLRLELELQDQWSAGIHEWRVE